MPPFVPLADGAQVEILYLFDGTTIENRLWFVDRSPPITSGHLLALASGVAGWHTTLVLPLLSHQIQLATVQARDWTVFDGPFENAGALFISGSNSSDSHSANVAVRVKFVGAFPPHIFNSNFVPGIPKDKVDINVVDPALVSGLYEAYAALEDLAPTFGDFPAWRWVVTSQIENLAYRTEQLARRTDFISIPSLYVSPRRRRLPRPPP